MIDLHTHLLPDWDNGAEDWDEMFKMAEIAHQDGCDTIEFNKENIQKGIDHGLEIAQEVLKDYPS